MLDEVESYYFVDQSYTQTTVLLQTEEEHETQQACPYGVGESSEALDAELMWVSCVKEARVDIEDA